MKKIMFLILFLNHQAITRGSDNYANLFTDNISNIVLIYSAITTVGLFYIWYHHTTTNNRIIQIQNEPAIIIERTFNRHDTRFLSLLNKKTTTKKRI